MDAFRLLGIGRDADEREIKRAYARLLKITRPDDDPVGFQRLNEAYQNALTASRQRTLATADDDDHEGEAGGTGMELRLTLDQLMELTGGDAAHAVPRPRAGNDTVATPAAVESPSHAGMDVAAVARQVLEHAQRETPSRLRDWLGQHDDLYLLVAKQRVGRAVLDTMVEDEIPLRAGVLQVLGAFFDFAPPEWIERRERVRRAVASEHTEAYDEEHSTAIRQLKRRFLWPQALLMACVPGLALRITTLAQRLETDYGDDVPGIDPVQRRFFGRIAYPFYFGAWRWASIVLSAVISTVLVSILARFVNIASERSVQVAGQVFTASAALLLMWHAMRLMWAMREAPHHQRSWLLALLPAWLALAGVASGTLLPDLPGLAYALAAPAALLYFQRFFDALRFGLGAAWLSTLLPDAVPSPSQWLLGLAGAALGMTIADAVHAYRHKLPVSAAVGNRNTMIASYVFFGVSILAALAF